MNKNCSVIVNTCDKYEDAWFPFFELVKKYWKGCQYIFYLNTESKQYTHDGLNVTVINENRASCYNASWGVRMKNCLKQIESKYVILLLEDFFLQDNVDQAELDSCIQMMENDENIKAIYFKQIDGYSTVYPKDQQYFIMSGKKRYILNLQAGLWRTEDLYALIDDNDTPWSFEEEGASRVSEKDVFLCSTRGTHTDMSNCAFPYLTDRRTGFGIWAGKWLWNNNKLFKKNGIEIGDIKLDRFTRIDMCKYYLQRLSQVITNKK